MKHMRYLASSHIGCDQGRIRDYCCFVIYPISEGFIEWLHSTVKKSYLLFQQLKQEKYFHVKKGSWPGGRQSANPDAGDSRSRASPRDGSYFVANETRGSPSREHLP